jgi:hypothetical protein
MVCFALVLRRTLSSALLVAACVLAASLASAQAVDMFPANAVSHWQRIGIPATQPVTTIEQWHIDAAHRTILCDGNGGHDWLRFNQELTNFDFQVKWRFVPKPDAKYNSGVFFRNSEDGSIWHQAQTKLDGGYLFGLTPRSATPTRFNLMKEMVENRVKPAGQWNLYRIHCEGGHCTLAVNGKVVNTVDIEVMKGYVGLEAEGAQILFKDFKLKQIK